jgi:hypothetical protein
VIYHALHEILVNSVRFDEQLLAAYDGVGDGMVNDELVVAAALEAG